MKWKYDPCQSRWELNRVSPLYITIEAEAEGLVLRTPGSTTVFDSLSEAKRAGYVHVMCYLLWRKSETNHVVIEEGLSQIEIMRESINKVQTATKEILKGGYHDSYTKMQLDHAVQSHLKSLEKYEQALKYILRR